MNNNIWNAAQMGGTGGALKALTKNLSNQLTLSPTEIKRVVARVISDCHYQGQMGDYNGHMFYLNPDRIDMTKQITDSKEAFDAMVEQKRILNKKASQHSPSSSRSRSLSCRLAVDLPPGRSLTGVMINQHHLRHPKTDIVVRMPSSPIIAVKSKPVIKRKPLKAPIKRNKNNKNSNNNRVQAAAQPKSKPKSKSVGKMQSVAKSKPVNKKKSLAQVKVVQLKTAISKNTGDALRPMKSVACMKPKSRTRAQVTSSTKASPPRAGSTAAKTSIIKNQNQNQKQNQKQKQSGRTPPKMKSHHQAHEQTMPRALNKKKSKRLTAGTLLPKPWCNPYQFQGGAGATYQPNPKPRNKVQPKSANGTRRTQTKRSQDRLAKHLEREEAIDDLDRLEASSMRHFRVKPRSKGNKRNYKISARLKELALPVQRHRLISEPSTLCNSESVLPLYRPTTKSRGKQRVLVDSSLGSIAVMKDPSRSETLSPAKRNLALAFMTNEGSRSPRYKRSVLWR